MSHRICCYTLFDITQTGVLNRSRPTEDNVQEWILKRNTQCNLDTILQVISLRSQPDQVKVPVRVEMKDSDFDMFGFLFRNDESQPTYCWKFEFEVHHTSVFENGIVPFGALYKDCEGVPMIVCPTQIAGITAFLDTTEELQNIYFEAL
jgi:hypothetical protein